jgi:glycosyltransferase involved in cell wall biosynthesis
MTLHNRAAYLAEAIASMLAQSQRDFILVLVDDGSTDETERIARSYELADTRVRYVRLPSRRGMIEAWRAAFEAASATGARYFAWASDHDKWHPQWLEKLMDVLDGSSSIVLAYPLTQRVDPEGRALTKPTRQFETFGIADRDTRWALLNRSETVAAGDMVYGLMRTDAVRDAGIFRDVLCPDRLLVAELTLQGEIRQVPEPLWYRRQFTEGSVERQRFTLFPPGTQPPSKFMPPWYMHARALWNVYGPGSHPRVKLSRTEAFRLVTAYAAAYASRHYAKSSVQRGILTVLGWPRWIYKRLKHAVLLVVYGVLVAMRQIGFTPLIERLCERLTGRPRPWRWHA